METKDDFIVCSNTEADNPQMARLIRCVIDEFGVSRTSMVYDDPATDCFFAYFVKSALKNESTCVGHRKYFRWQLRVLSSAIASMFIFRGSFCLSMTITECHSCST